MRGRPRSSSVQSRRSRCGARKLLLAPSTTTRKLIVSKTWRRLPRTTSLTSCRTAWAMRKDSSITMKAGKRTFCIRLNSKGSCCNGITCIPYRCRRDRLQQRSPLIDLPIVQTESGRPNTESIARRPTIIIARNTSRRNASGNCIFRQGSQEI
jgi:hypothetical protein